MKENKEMMYAVLTNRIFLGLLMLVPGLTKLFIMGPDAIVGMLAGLGFPLAGFFAWVLILSEIVFGVTILFNYKMRYSVIAPIIILVVAALMINLQKGDWNGLIMHFALAANYWVFGAWSTKKH